MSSGVGGSRVSIPSNVRKTIQNIREITGKQHSDDEIYSVLKECSMDPNETAQKLLYLGIFQFIYLFFLRGVGVSFYCKGVFVCVSFMWLLGSLVEEEIVGLVIDGFSGLLMRLHPSMGWFFFFLLLIFRWVLREVVKEE